jgi:UDP-N-acetylmuramoyl-L-alanyl-D-glutamate--2,6-diaminopimelate ligase
MKISRLVEKLWIKRIVGSPETEIFGMNIHSSSVNRGDLFICLPGKRTDGHQYVEEAVANGCTAILAEQEPDHLPENISTVIVPDSRRAMAIMANEFYSCPSRQLNLIGVTGTNGKTTVTHLIDKILNDYGKTSGLIGTLYMKIGNLTERTPLTTPESYQLQRILRKMADRGAEYAVLEVSSHALKMGRVHGCDFKTAVFTNLTHDHLDYHRDMESYLHDKSLLFSQLGNTYGQQPKVAVLNADDPASVELAANTSAQIITYGIHRSAHVRARNITMKPGLTCFVADTFCGSFPMRMKLAGEFNVYNALAAITACMVENIPLSDIKRSLETFTGVKGRFEQIYASQRFTVIVDYAHNPDGLINVIKTARKFTNGRIISLIGCEGDRDKAKRPVMAAKAALLSDMVILTSDNPRSENPEHILDDMVSSLSPLELLRCIRITDRGEAISQAISLATPGDCILITGKGHETHQILADRKVPFDDTEVALAFINNHLRRT